MRPTRNSQDRREAIARAETCSPFLRDALRAVPDIGELFLARGAEAAACASLEIKREDVESALRARRQALALAVALGDLAGELSLERVTALLSDFADRRDSGGAEARNQRALSRCGTRGFAVLALGKLGSVELNYSSDVDLSLLFDPETLPRRPREDPGEAAVRIGRRMIEILQRRTEPAMSSGST